MWQSDAYTTVYCERCGILAEAAPPKTFKQGLTVHSKPYCRYCHRHDTVHAVDLPYAQKLFIQELGGLGIATRLSNKKL